jgi:hypothetical protein
VLATKLCCSKTESSSNRISCKIVIVVVVVVGAKHSSSRSSSWSGSRQVGAKTISGSSSRSSSRVGW